VFDAEVAADLLAETFAVAHERRARFRDVGKPGGAWLHGIAAKELSHWFRRQEVERRAVRRLGIEMPQLDDESIARIEALADVGHQREALAGAMARMTSDERVAVELRVVDELAYAEIAARLDCTENTARQRVHRGLARLNNLMQAEAVL
jgi:RNA polymerase sigma factor (sigma-70 family)